MCALLIFYLVLCFCCNKKVKSQGSSFSFCIWYKSSPINQTPLPSPTCLDERGWVKPLFSAAGVFQQPPAPLLCQELPNKQDQKEVRNQVFPTLTTTVVLTCFLAPHLLPAENPPVRNCLHSADKQLVHGQVVLIQITVIKAI